MMVDRLENIYMNCPHNVPLVGMDVGAKTIGLAVCDAGHCVATPVTTIKRTKFSKDIVALARFIRDYDIGGCVIGYPISMDGREGARCQSIRDFALEFKAQCFNDICGEESWVSLWDERLSTASVEDFVRESVGISTKKAKARGVTDKLAAQVILQGALDYMDRARDARPL